LIRKRNIHPMMKRSRDAGNFLLMKTKPMQISIYGDNEIDQPTSTGPERM